MRVFSGVQPSGILHIGNYFGAIKNHIDMQFVEGNECVYFVANYHALTSTTDAESLRKNTFEVVLTYLSLGLDPEKTTFYLQSDLPELTELTWILSNLTPMGLMERCHSYKDKVAKGLTSHVGLFSYPILMTSDILLPKADVVPVGKDQKQHVEVARDLAIKFNNTYGETFTVPKPIIKEDVAVIPGVDGQKMSKSYNNTIPIFAEEKVIKKAIMGIVTDSKGVEEPKDPDTCNVFQIYKLFLSEDEQNQLAEKYRAGGMGYGDVKKALFAHIWEYFRPYREKREKLLDNKDFIYEVLAQGKQKIHTIADPLMTEIRKKVGLSD